MPVRSRSSPSTRRNAGRTCTSSPRDNRIDVSLGSDAELLHRLVVRRTRGRSMPPGHASNGLLLISIALASALPPFRSAAVSLSVVIPAFHEERRILPTLSSSLEYLEQHWPGKWELIVVDDGSRDDTAKTVQGLGLGPALRLLRANENGGKGAAVVAGTAAARGDLLLLMDADGATPIDQLAELETTLRGADAQIVVGSRAAVLARRPLPRQIMGRGFALAAASCVRGIEDTQCGFKLLTRTAAAATLPHLHVDGWAFDVELLFLAQKLGFRVASAAVEWRDVPGSKIRWDTPLTMLRDIICIRVFYAVGLWSEKHVRTGHSYKEVRPSASGDYPDLQCRSMSNWKG